MTSAVPIPTSSPTRVLRVDDDELAACVSCGLCLPHCPTYRVTGDESASPRGRITAMREVEAGAPLDGPFMEFMDLCVQCRGCEAACPSGVPFGRLMEGARETLTERTGYQPWWRRLPFKLLGHHRALLIATRAGAIAQRLGLVPERLAERVGLPELPLRQEPLLSTVVGPRTFTEDGFASKLGAQVWLFTGCVMDAWQRPVHAAAIRVVEATGTAVALPGKGGDCCGALHIHAGLHDDAKALAERVMGSMPGHAPILVDSAGCGAALKDYGRLVGTPESAGFAGRVQDIQEWLATPHPATGRAPVADLPWVPGEARLPFSVAVHDPCHLRHVQRAHQHVRTALAPFVDTAELDDEGLCCGAGGAYSALHPEMATDIRQRKLDAIARTGSTVVASANPGCSLFLAAAGIDVRHPIELIDEALNGR